MGGLLFYVVLICDFMSTGRDFNKQLYYYYYYVILIKIVITRYLYTCSYKAVLAMCQIKYNNLI